MDCMYDARDRKVMEISFRTKNKSRLQELIDFIRVSGFKKIGIANCKAVQKYADKLADWYNANIAADFCELRAFATGILQEEAELDEIVRLVGADALSYKDRLTMETAKSIREDYLHQNAFHETDTYTSLKKQHKILKLIYDFHVLAGEALERDAEFEDIVNLPVREKIGRAKYIEEEKADRIDAIEDEMKKELKALGYGDSDEQGI